MTTTRTPVANQIKINGVERAIDADPQVPLLWAIRDTLGLNAAGKQACDLPITMERLLRSGPPIARRREDPRAAPWPDQLRQRGDAVGR